MMKKQSFSTTTYLDAHSHLHDQLPVENFLTAARNNFRHRIATQETNALNLMLCLADYPGAEGFPRLQEQVGQIGLSGWQSLPTEEAESLLLEHGSGDRLWVLAGRQIISAERLEVMGIGITEVIPDGLNLPEILRRINEHKALAVLPWGVGKWWGHRRRIVTEALGSYGRNLLFCDNGGRPWIWRPRLLAMARNRGITVLSGSDPLNLKSDCLRSGSFGVTLAEAAPITKPTVWLIRKLRLLSASPAVIGQPSGNWSFIRNQVALRLKAKSC